MGKIININNLAFEKENENTNIFAFDGEENAIYSKSGMLKEVNNSYWKISEKGEVKISNFAIVPLELIQMEDYAELKVRFLTEDGSVYEDKIKTSDFYSTSKFKSITCGKHLDLLFKGNDDDLVEMKDIINQKQYLTKQGVSYTGVVKNKDNFVFVSAKGTIDSKSTYINDLVFVGDNDLSINTHISDKDPIWEPELEELSKALFKFNDLTTTATIIGFCASCFLKEKLYLLNETKFNHLVMSGEAGSGKSETVSNIIMSLFSTKSSTSASQCTKFVTTKIPSSSNTIPFIVEEYKPTRLSKERMNIISDILRNAYDRTPAFRGRTDQRLNKYQVLTPIILVGEMAFEESAALERSLLVYFSKSRIKDEDRQKAFKYLRDNKELVSRLGRSLLEEALNIDPAILINRQKVLFNEIEGSLPSRVVNSVVNCMLGILLLVDVYKSMCFDLKECTGYSVEELFAAIIEAVKLNLLDGKEAVNGAVENCLELFNDMAEQGCITKGQDFQVIKGEELALDIKSIYGRFVKYAREHVRKDLDILSEKQFKKQLTFKEYYIDGNRTVAFNDGYQCLRKKAVILNIDKLRNIIDISNLCN